MDILSAVILGVVQGITEFLPVSSTGHLILMHSVLGIEDANGLAFDAVLHFATALAVVVYFYDEIQILAQTVLRKLGRLPVNEKDFIFVQALVVGTVPAILLGVLLESSMESIFRNPLLVALILFLGSILFIVAEYHYENNFHNKEIDVKTGWKIGLFQTLALIPGMSRSGATIVGGMFLGLSRSDAARFSFLLAIPLMLGAGSKKILELMSAEANIEWSSILFGAGSAFVVGILAIHFMIGFVRKHTLWPFIWYRILLAIFIVFVTFFG